MSDAPEGGEAPAAAGPKKMVLIGTLVGGLVVGTAAGMFALGPKLSPAPTAEQMEALAAHEAAASKGKKKEKKKAEGGHGKEGEAAAAPVIRLDNLIVNPAGSDGARFVMASVAIELESEEDAAVLKEREIELRDQVTSILAAQTLMQLAAPDSRTQLKSKIATAVLPMLGEDAEAPKIWLPQFVIQ